MLEAQIDVSNFRGQASQSFQVAPFDEKYRIVEDVSINSACLVLTKARPWSELKRIF